PAVPRRPKTLPLAHAGLLRPRARCPARSCTQGRRLFLGLARGRGWPVRRLPLGARRAGAQGPGAHAEGRLLALRRCALRRADARLSGTVIAAPPWYSRP